MMTIPPFLLLSRRLVENLEVGVGDDELVAALVHPDLVEQRHAGGALVRDHGPEPVAAHPPVEVRCEFDSLADRAGADELVEVHGAPLSGETDAVETADYLGNFTCEGVSVAAGDLHLRTLFHGVVEGSVDDEPVFHLDALDLSGGSEAVQVVQCRCHVSTVSP